MWALGDEDEAEEGDDREGDVEKGRLSPEHKGAEEKLEGHTKERGEHWRWGHHTSPPRLAHLCHVGQDLQQAHVFNN